ncbi:WG repeat-containing protein [Dokdonia ponticola]|uniref:WG repeat-containing protein n=1 Tax=Dokdonia ponticola TaxID=2041041 RepID=A0ABV9HTU6_9FLAO
MKTIFLISILMFSISLQAQIIENIEQITPFHDTYAAIQKGDQWAFIDKEGTIVVDFRNDLVPIPCVHGKNEIEHPIFNAGLSLIKQTKENIEYYGYINTSGEIVIEPQFIKALPYNDAGLAIVHKLTRETIGQNSILNKDLIRYTYGEIVIDSTGNMVKYLLGPTHVIPNKGRFLKIYPIKSYFIDDFMVATQGDNKKWTIYHISTM